MQVRNDVVRLENTKATVWGNYIKPCTGGCYKKIVLSLIILLFISALSMGATPDYAKWGTIAVKETQKRYNAEIIDYKHIGRTDLNSKMSEVYLQSVGRRHDLA